MLTLYRRHGTGSDGEPCKHKSKGMSWKRCSCLIWVHGSLDYKPIRESMDTRDWAKAAGIVQGWEAAGTRTPEQVKGGITIQEARFSYERNMESRRLGKGTRANFKSLLGQIDRFCTDQGIRNISQLDLRMTEKFRESWKHTGGSTNGKLKLLRTYFAFLVDREWMVKNWAKKMKLASEKLVPTMPFSKTQMQEILAACDLSRKSYPRITQANQIRLRTLCLLMRYTGLRIGDASTLAVDRLDGRKLFLYTAKTGTPVYTLLPELVVKELNECPRVIPKYWFWSGFGEPTSIAIGWRWRFTKMCKNAKPPILGAHPHRFRDTFAVECLLAGVPIKQVSMLLGHSTVKMTETHYAPWIQESQDQAIESLERTWAKDEVLRDKVVRLVRVK